jgi:hypothetical protein
MYRRTTSTLANHLHSSGWVPVRSRLGLRTLWLDDHSTKSAEAQAAGNQRHVKFKSDHDVHKHGRGPGALEAATKK